MEVSFWLFHLVTHPSLSIHLCVSPSARILHLVEFITLCFSPRHFFVVVHCVGVSTCGSSYYRCLETGARRLVLPKPTCRLRARVNTNDNWRYTKSLRF